MSSSNLRKVIQILILEAQETQEQKNKRWQIKYPGQNLDQMSTRKRGFWGHQKRLSKENPEVFDNLGVHSEEDQEQTSHVTTNLPKNKKLKELRRILKNHWNDWVYNKEKTFLEFWNGEDSPILAVHWIDLLTQPTPDKFLAGIESYVQRKDDSGKKPDLSCVGYKEFNDKKWRNKNSWNEKNVKQIPPKSAIGLLFHRRNINWASYSDAWTEFISSAGADELEFYRNSNLPKRPSLPVSPHFVTIDPEDLNLGNILAEVIISDYDWDTAMIVRSYCDDIGVNIDDITKIFERNNIQYIIK